MTNFSNTQQVYFCYVSPIIQNTYLYGTNLKHPKFFLFAYLKRYRRERKHILLDLLGHRDTFSFLSCGLKVKLLLPPLCSMRLLLGFTCVNISGSMLG